MRIKRTVANDPVEIGICAGCGNPIYSNENYWLSGEDMIHADGIGARGKTVGESKDYVTIGCLHLYLSEVFEDGEVAKALGIERKNADGTELFN